MATTPTVEAIAAAGIAQLQAIVDAGTANAVELQAQLAALQKQIASLQVQAAQLQQQINTAMGADALAAQQAIRNLNTLLAGGRVSPAQAR